VACSVSRGPHSHTLHMLSLRLGVGGHWFAGFIIVLALFAPGSVVRLEAAKFRHAQWGPVDIYTSDTPDSTKRFVAELMEVRRQIQDLVSPVPLANPRMEILIFNEQRDYEEFQPVRTTFQGNERTVSGFVPRDYGLVISVVKEGEGYEFARASIRLFYAHHLLQTAVPGAPIWVRTGLAEFLGATVCRGNKIYVGGDFMNHAPEVRAAKLLPLAKLMDDAEMKPYFGAVRHDNVLYHESWALWHQWLTSADPGRRSQIRRLFAAIRSGQPGNFATVAEAFGETPAAIEAARRPPRAPRGFRIVESNLDAMPMVAGLAFLPATELDQCFSQAMVAAGTGKGPGSIGYNLVRLDRGEPLPARVAEARAVLATGENDLAQAKEHWETARDRGTVNAYAYLQPAKLALENRNFPVNLRAQLPENLCAGWRENLKHCLELDPGCADAHYFRVIVEAFAPTPDRAAIDAADRCGTLEVRQLGFFYLAIARWRLGQFDEAHRLLAELQLLPRLPSEVKDTFANVDELMREEEARKKE